MLKNIGLIIVCNLLMYLILLLIWKFVKIKNKRQSNYKHKNDQVNVLNDKVNELEKKIFIQDILNHASLENEINEKIYYANKIIETYKDEAIGYYYRGNLYVKFEKYDEAIKDFEKTLEIDENFKVNLKESFTEMVKETGMRIDRNTYKLCIDLLED